MCVVLVCVTYFASQFDKRVVLQCLVFTPVNIHIHFSGVFELRWRMDGGRRVEGWRDKIGGSTER